MSRSIDEAKLNILSSRRPPFQPVFIVGLVSAIPFSVILWFKDTDVYIIKTRDMSYILPNFAWFINPSTYAKNSNGT